MIIDYTKNTYDSVSLLLIVGLFENLKSRGYKINQTRIEVQINQKVEFLKFDSEGLDSFLTYATSFIKSSSVVGDAVTIIRNINTTVENISNEFITWNADFEIEITKEFGVIFKDSKKQDNLRQEGIDIHVDRYKYLFLDFINKYIELIQDLIRQKELVGLDLNLSRYVDPFYVTDDQGIDTSYVFP